MRIHQLAVADALVSLQTTAGGLSATEASRRLVEFGPNAVERIAGPSWIVRIARELSHFFALVLWAAAALAFLAERASPGGGMQTLGFAIVAVILINAVFSFWQTYRAERAIAALQKLLPREVRVLRAGQLQSLPAHQLVPGDIVDLEEGDDVPADCRVVLATGLRVNTATITGESFPRARSADPSDEESAVHSRNVLLAGTNVMSGQARAVVFATGMRTEFGRIAALTQAVEDSLSPLQREIVRLSRLIAAIATGLGLTFFAIGRSVGLSSLETSLFAIGIVVANVPEGLLPTVTLAMAMASQRMARRQVLIRHLPAVETLGATTVICTDKTGTLTENRMDVHGLFFVGRHLPANELLTADDLRGRARRLFETAWLCENVRIVHEGDVARTLGDSMEIALSAFAERGFDGRLDYLRLDSIPFDADRKRLVVLHRGPDGPVVSLKGALESVLPLCTDVQGTAGIEPLTADWRSRLLAAENQMADAGLRVLALAHRDAPDGTPLASLEQGLVLSGLVGLHDPPRREVPEAIETCRRAGIKVVMITGDHAHTARAIARQIGLVRLGEPVVITGDQLARLSDVQLQLALDAPEILFARATAEEKCRIVAALQRKHEVVAVTGDGVNDAPALRAADVGVAMGRSGTDVAREAADVVLLDDNFASIVDGVREGRTVFDNIRKFLGYILTSNVPELVPYLAFVLLKVPLPLTIIQILAVDLGTDIVPALGLGVERPHDGVMNRPPRSRITRLIDTRLLVHGYLFLGLMEAVAALSAYFFVIGPAAWHTGGPPDRTLYLQSTTACLSAIVVMQIVNVFLWRDTTGSILRLPFAGNRLILTGIAVETATILAIVYTPAGHLLFGTAPLPASVWIFIAPFAAGMLVIEEARKALYRRLRRCPTT